jgi:hypothetical protein
MTSAHRDSTKIIRRVLVFNWNNREVLGRFFREVEKGTLVNIACEDKDGKYNVEGRVLFRYGSRGEMRPEMEHPDGVVLNVKRGEEVKKEIVPYSVIKGYSLPEREAHHAKKR